MPKQNVREMSRFQLWRHSLGTRMFRVVLILTIIIGLAATIGSSLLYDTSIKREFKSVAWNIARTATAVLDKDKAADYSNALLRRFETLSDEEILQMDKSDNEAYFEDLMDAGYISLRAKLHNIQVESEALSVYLAAFDVENSRIIYLIDSDYSETFCPPGSVDYLDPEELETFLGHIKGDKMHSYLFGSQAVPASISDTKEYGYICTAGDQMYAGIRNYPIYIFTDLDMNEVVKLSKQFLTTFALFLLLIAVIICFLTTFYIRRKVVQPINKLASAAESYAQGKKALQEGKSFFENLDIHTGDEIENLSVIMRDMEIDITAYEENIRKETKEKERIKTELYFAKKIQTSMVPNTFPPFPGRKEFDLYATMTPAKQIGGDFYDFYQIGDDHVVLVIADVSGKGIPAALFMMSSKILIKNIASLGIYNPAEILERVNNEICNNNQAEMFVTVWIGILEISTGKMKCANAGHEYPALYKKGGAYELFRDPHGFVIGGMEGLKYKEYELTLEPGERLFVYTDGVTEASNKEEELFGTDRMLEALNMDPETGVKETLDNMHKQIRNFVQGADQFDDITMMEFVYYGKEESKDA